MDISKILITNAEDAMFDSRPEIFYEGKSDAALLEAIETRVEALLDRDPGLLFSYLYRLDIEEERLQFILGSAMPIDLVKQLSNEILQRQLTRLNFKKTIHVPRLDDEWSW